MNLCMTVRFQIASVEFREPQDPYFTDTIQQMPNTSFRWAGQAYMFVHYYHILNMVFDSQGVFFRTIIMSKCGVRFTGSFSHPPPVHRVAILDSRSLFTHLISDLVAAPMPAASLKLRQEPALVPVPVPASASASGYYFASVAPFEYCPACFLRHLY